MWPALAAAEGYDRHGGPSISGNGIMVGLVTRVFMSHVRHEFFNPPYYQQLSKIWLPAFFHQLCFVMERKPLNAKILSRHGGLASDPAYQARHIDKSSWRSFARDFTVIYISLCRAWGT